MMYAKRGQVQYFLFALLAVVIFLTAIYIMLSFNSDFKESASGFSVASNLNFYEEYVNEEINLIFGESVKRCANCGVDLLKQEIIKVAEERDILRISEVGNFYGLLRNGQFTLIETHDGYELGVEGLFVNVKNGYSSGRRAFDYCSRFGLD